MYRWHVEEKLYSERIIEEKIVPHITEMPHITEVPPVNEEIKEIIKKENNPSTSKRRIIDESRLKGYTGDICPQCGQSTMVRNGTCLKCTTCGTTTGCS